MNNIVLVSGLIAFAAVGVCLAGLAVSVIRSVTGDSCASWSRNNLAALVILSMVSSLILLRPHEDTFQGLDSAAYRLMAESFKDGRGFRSVDKVLQEVPRDLRKWLLLRSDCIDRVTRDRSFQIESLETCAIKPFFYPTLPLSMLGFDICVPGKAADYFVPLAGLVFCVVLVLVGISKGGTTGGVAAIALFLGSPLPVWTLRGCFAESVGGVLVSMAALSWIINQPGRAPLLAAFALGLAVSFHPVMIVLSIPLIGVMLMGINSAGRISLMIMMFGLGLVPVVLMTLYVTAPYVRIDMESLVYGIKGSASLRSAVAAACLMGVVSLLGVTFRNRLSTFPEVVTGGGVLVRIVLLILWVLPVMLAVIYWSQGAVVKHGIKELLDGLRLPFGLLLAALCSIVLLSKADGRSLSVLTIVFLTLPVFLYLKGAEQMGMWSQRRLIAPLLLLLACCLPPAAGLMKKMLKDGAGKKIYGTLALVVVLVVCGLSNAVRWPAPYLVCYEQGADAWVSRMLNKIGGNFAAFDYFAYSVPLQVRGNVRVVGLSELGYDGLPMLSKWLTEKAAKEEVLWVTAYGNPGLEDGCLLEEIGSDSVSLYRLVSKTSLPAERRAKKVDAKILKVSPVENNRSMCLNKILDDGPLALRGPWGKKSGMISMPDGRKLCARWSREGSGIVGPVPLPGQSVNITIEAAASRDDGVQGQALKIKPPWDGNDLVLTVSNAFTSVSGILSVPAAQKDDGRRTGVYKIYSDKPYDPAGAGIKGYEKDLGARIHLIRMECLAPGQDSTTKAPSTPR